METGKSAPLPMRAALYARVSSEQQAQQGTIESQVEMLKQRIQADGLIVDDELCFIEDGYTGSTLARPALERLRDIAWAGGFQRLYVHSPDRLARKYAWQMILVEELNRSGVELVFLNHSIGDSAEDALLLQVQGVIAEYERTKIMERSRRGKRHAARCGSINVLCGAPYGYRYLSKHTAGGQAQYVINFEEARVTQQIFEWVGRDRSTLREVSRRLAREGIASAKGKHWCAATVRKLLTNPAYKGQAIWGKSRCGERRPRLRPARGHPEHSRITTSRYAGKPEDQIAIPVPAIVTPELFDAAAEQMAENRATVRTRSRGATYLLQGLLACGCCGYSWYGHGLTRFRRIGGFHPYYRCLGRDAFRFGGKAICTNNPVRLDRLEEAVWSDVQAVLKNPADLREEFERRLKGDGVPDVSLEQLTKQNAAVQRNISRLIDAYEGGLLEKEEFEPRVKQARQRIERLRQEVSAAKEAAAQKSELRLVLGHLDEFAERIRQGLDQADWHTRRDIIRSLVKVITVDRDQVRITYRISPRPFAEGRSSGPILQHCSYRVLRDDSGHRQEGQRIPVPARREEGRVLRVRQVAETAEADRPGHAPGFSLARDPATVGQNPRPFAPRRGLFR